MKPANLLQRITSSQTNVRFRDLIRLVEALGFILDRTRGGHFIYRHPSLPELLNLQNDRGQAKPYQVRQLLRLIEERMLRLEETE